MRKLLICVVVILGGLSMAACTPEERAILGAMWEWQVSPSADCYEAIDKHWPQESQGWADGVMWRESRNNPSAANTSSSARGCFQLLLSYHSWRYRAVGCSSGQWMDPDCNVKAAVHLYLEQGTTPWRLTSR